MSGSKEPKNVTWTPIMTDFLLNYLSKQPKYGRKCPNGYKISVYRLAAEEINKRFDEKLLYENIQNHLKSIKRWWKTIQRLKNMEGVFFNHNTNTIEMNREEYKKYIEEYPTDAKFINRPIRNYKQIQIVCGKSTELEINDSAELGFNNSAELEINDSAELGFNNSAEVGINNSEIILEDGNLEIDYNENNNAKEIEFEDEEIQTITPISNESRKRKNFDENDEKISKNVFNYSSIRYTKTNAKWNPIMTGFLLNFLKEEIKSGQRSSNNKFKNTSLINAADSVNEKFGRKLRSEHITNHLKTIRRWWVSIERIKKLNGVSFNNDDKIIKMPFNQYRKYVQENPRDEQFINKPIKYYDEMEIIYGNKEEENNNPPNEDLDLWTQNEDLDNGSSSNGSRKRKKLKQIEEISPNNDVNLKKNLSWSREMSDFLVKFLANEARIGLKGPNGFKSRALIKAVRAIKERFGKDYNCSNIHNHLKSVKRRWKNIQNLKEMNGVIFNQETNTIEMGLEEYQNHILERPFDDQFINKPIKYLIELEIVCGNNSDLLNTPLIPLSPHIEYNIRNNSREIECEEQDLNNLIENNEEQGNFTNNINEENLKKNVTWNREMSDFVLKFLANEARMGFKAKNGFKSSALNRASRAITEKFGKDMSFANVQNHMKSLKRRHRLIQNLKNINGAVFNQETSTIEMGLEEYQNHIQERPTDDQFINKPIKYLTELEIVGGNEDLLNTPLIPLSPNIEFNFDNDSREIEYNEAEEEEEQEEVDLDNLIENIEQNSREFNVSRKRKEKNQLDINNNNNSSCEISSLDPKMDNGNLDLVALACEDMQIWTIQKKFKQNEGNFVNNRKDENSRKNVSWNHEMSDFLVKYLANEARMGFKRKKGFKASALVRASRAITEKFGKNMSYSHVQNHMKSLKRRYKTIQSLKNMNGVVFNEETNTIEMGPEEYQNHVQGRPSDDQFINTPIKLLTEMEIVCGNDKSLFKTPLIPLSPNIELSNDNNSMEIEENEEINNDNISRENEEEEEKEDNNNNNNEKEHSKSFNSPKRNKTNQIIENDENLTSPNITNINSRVNEEKEEEIQHLTTPNQNTINSIQNKNNEEPSNQSQKTDPTAEKLLTFVGQMTESLKESSNSNDKAIKFAKEIMQELREIKGEFPSRALRSAQRYLVENGLDGACFMSYDKEEKISWMNDFINENLGGNV